MLRQILQICKCIRKGAALSCLLKETDRGCFLVFILHNDLLRGMHPRFFYIIQNKLFCVLFCVTRDVHLMLCNVFLICILACSYGLQHCSTTPHSHQNCSFSSQVYKASPSLNVIGPPCTRRP